MANGELNVVTGAFSYTGRYITQRLLAAGKKVRTLTGHPDRESPFSDQVVAFPFNFDRPIELASSLRGAITLYNTYWVRFPYRQVTFDKAIENTRVLIKAAEEAGVKKLVHLSITNPSEDSPFPYFRGKALVEKAILQSRLSYVIVRPTVIFGTEGVLLNNIAWFLRRFPIFTIPGSGDYRLQPVFVEDVAEIAVNAAEKAGNVIVDAVGSEIYTFEELVQLIARSIQSRARILQVQPSLALFLSRLVGFMVKDTVLTRDEVKGLMAGLLISRHPPLGKTAFSSWLGQNSTVIGRQYLSELKRHY